MARKAKRKSDQPANVGGTIIIRNAAEQRAYDRQFSDALIGHTRDWMTRNAPTMSVDVLACQPDRALELGLYVGRQMQRIKAVDAALLRMALSGLIRNQGTVDTIAAILRAVMNARKAGKLKGGRR